MVAGAFKREGELRRFGGGGKRVGTGLGAKVQAPPLEAVRVRAGEDGKCGKGEAGNKSWAMEDDAGLNAVQALASQAVWSAVAHARPLTGTQKP